jgi:hypothetical protein
LAGILFSSINFPYANIPQLRYLSITISDKTLQIWKKQHKKWIKDKIGYGICEVLKKHTLLGILFARHSILTPHRI